MEFFIYFLMSGIFLFVQYLIIKAAVKNAIHEKLGDRDFIKHVVNITMLSKKELDD
ncbi:MAG: hypothetical protein ACYDEI_08075 [Erysipelotrichaceae bacterium]